MVGWLIDIPLVQDLQYDVLRDVLLASSPIAEHETLNHPVSCEYAIGPLNIADDHSDFPRSLAGCVDSV